MDQTRFNVTAIAMANDGQTCEIDLDLLYHINDTATHESRRIKAIMVHSNAMDRYASIIRVNLAQNGVRVQCNQAERYAFQGFLGDVMKHLCALVVVQRHHDEPFMIAKDGAVARPDLGPDEMVCWDHLLVGELAGERHVG